MSVEDHVTDSKQCDMWHPGIMPTGL